MTDDFRFKGSISSVFSRGMETGIKICMAFSRQGNMVFVRLLWHWYKGILQDIGRNHGASQ